MSCAWRANGLGSPRPSDEQWIPLPGILELIAVSASMRLAFVTAVYVKRGSGSVRRGSVTLSLPRRLRATGAG